MSRYVFLFQIKDSKSHNLSYFILIYTYSNMGRSGFNR